MNGLLGGLNVIESPRIEVGTIIASRWDVYMHPLDVVALQHPDLDAVGRVMVLVDRVVARALARIERS